LSGWSRSFDSLADHRRQSDDCRFDDTDRRIQSGRDLGRVTGDFDIYVPTPARQRNP
jgi:hypothetical protein